MPDARTFVEAETLDQRLLELRDAAATGAPDCALSCRLAEALLHRGRREEAVECCRLAWPFVGDDPQQLQICGWVFSNGACHDEAAAAYHRLIGLRPEWIAGYRHLSGELAAAGLGENAIAHAQKACELAPDDAEFALHAAALLTSARRFQEAAAYLDRALAFAGGYPHTIADAAELLMRGGRVETAAALLASCDCGADARCWRVRSAAEMMCGRDQAALAAIDQALALAPDIAEYHLHRGHLLRRLDDLAAAAQAFECARALDPESREVRHARMDLYVAAGLVREATVAGGDLLQRFPDDQRSAEAVLHLLNHRLETIDGDYVVLSADAPRGPRSARRRPGMRERWATQRRVLRALILRETRTRFAEYRLGYAWALLEPILHICLLSAMFAVLMHGRPPIGRHFFMFYYTGLIRYSGANGTSRWAFTAAAAGYKQ
jgi:tetratricopeptide (TPR) repeat protein